MYKNLISFFILFLCIGCSFKNNNNVNTIIKQNNSVNIAINYPITNTKLDKIIKEDIDKIYNDFKKNSSKISKNELNIDYTFNKLNNYISIGLFIYKDINLVKSTATYTYFYHTKNNKLMSLEDIIEDIDVIKDITVNFNKFTIDNDNLTIYDNIPIDIPISDLDFKISISTKQTHKVANKIIKKRIIDPNNKMIALTFDDGPSNYTNELIEYLNKENCNATFFILGNKVNLYSDLLNKSISFGNEIGNHSYNHKWMAKLNEKEISEQINKTQLLIKENTGYTPKLLRPTYGSINDTIKKISNLDIVLWNVDTMDWKYKSVDKIVSNATKNLKDGNIILFHDTHKRTIDAIKKIVPIIKSKGFVCVTVSELKEANLIRKHE